MTSLNAPGFSISLLNVSSIIRDLRASSVERYTSVDDILQLLDAPTDALAWIGVRVQWPDSARDRGMEEQEADLLLESRRRNDHIASVIGQDVIDTHSSTSSSERSKLGSIIHSTHHELDDFHYAACGSTVDM